MLGITGSMGEVGYRDLFDEYPYMTREAFALFWDCLRRSPETLPASYVLVEMTLGNALGSCPAPPGRPPRHRSRISHKVKKPANVEIFP